MKKYVLDDFDKFHDYDCLIPARIIYFGSEYVDDYNEEEGVDFASSRKVIKNLLFLDEKNDDDIKLYWSSPGGDWDRGMAIYDVITGLRSNVTMVGFGMVRSMGTIIMQACHRRILSPNCSYMIHDGFEALSGTPKHVERWAKYCAETREMMYDIYLERIRVKHPKFKKETLSNMCTIDTILSGKEAIDLGLADEIIGAENGKRK